MKPRFPKFGGIAGGSPAGALSLCCLCAALSGGPLFADGVTRAVEPVAGGCRVTLSWEFSGKVESDLVIEERFAQGWAVEDATVPFRSLDASWFSGPVARFAVKPSLLSGAGSITFTVADGGGAASGTASGTWKMYLGGSLRSGAVSGADALTALAAGTTGGTTGGGTGTGAAGEGAGESVSITSFKMTGEGVVLSYSGIAGAGVLVVEGCEGLGRPWAEVRRQEVPAGDGSVVVATGDAGASRFFRLKLIRKE